jgi:hypothetical protein
MKAGFEQNCPSQLVLDHSYTMGYILLLYSREFG